MTGKCREHLNTFTLNENASCIGSEVKRRALEKLNSVHIIGVRARIEPRAHCSKASANIERTLLIKWVRLVLIPRYRAGSWLFQQFSLTYTHLWVSQEILFPCLASVLSTGIPPVQTHTTTLSEFYNYSENSKYTQPWRTKVLNFIMIMHDSKA